MLPAACVDRQETKPLESTWFCNATAKAKYLVEPLTFTKRTCVATSKMKKPDRLAVESDAMHHRRFHDSLLHFMLWQSYRSVGETSIREHGGQISMFGMSVGSQ